MIMLVHDVTEQLGELDALRFGVFDEAFLGVDLDDETDRRRFGSATDASANLGHFCCSRSTLILCLRLRQERA